MMPGSGPSPTAPTISMATRISGTARIKASSARTGPNTMRETMVSEARMARGIDRITAPREPRIAILSVSALPFLISAITVGSGGNIRPRKSAIRGPAETRRDNSTSVVAKDQRIAPAIRVLVAKPPNLRWPIRTPPGGRNRASALPPGREPPSPRPATRMSAHRTRSARSACR